jgi:hypothetical protein
MSVENQKLFVFVWTKIAETWNNPDFNPATEAMPNEHPNFAISEIISHELVACMSAAMAEKVELKWNEVKNKLTWMIRNWELSGQGVGGLQNILMACLTTGCSMKWIVAFHFLITITLTFSIFGLCWKGTNSLHQHSRN